RKSKNKMIKQVREEIMKGVYGATEVVASTMGPQGNLIAIEVNGSTVFSKDGVYCLSYVPQNLDGWEKFGASVLLQAARNTLQKAGDGTTTTCVMTRGLMKGIERSEHSPTYAFFDELEEDIKKVVSSLKNMSREATKEVIKRIAMVSSNFDKSIAEPMAEVAFELGPEGQTYALPSPTGKTYYEIHEGYSCPSGVLSPDFLTNRTTEKLNNPYVLIVEQKINSHKELIGLYNKIKVHFRDANNIAPILMIVGDIEPDVAKFMLSNARNPKPGTPPIRIYPIKSPEVGLDRYDILCDIAELTGATVFSSFNSHNVSKFSVSDLGRAKFAEVGMQGFRIATDTSTEALVEKIRGEESGSEDLKKQRISMLQKGLATIFVGGDTTSSMQQNDQVIEDVMLACKAAMESGVVLGGGHGLMEVNEYVYNHPSVISTMLRSVFEQLSANAELNVFWDKEKPFDFLSKTHKDRSEFEIYTPIAVLEAAMKGALSVTKQCIRTKYGLKQNTDT
ncbi:MAG: TCP-1/cpn60 chaperonin family protein, partial [Bacteroidia bacterium]